MNFIARAFLSITALASLYACSIHPDVKVPINFETHSLCAKPCKDLVIFLPGRGDRLDAFEQAGFLKALSNSETAMNAIAVDAHLGYYRAGMLANRINEDILQPSVEQGYDRIYLVGTSLGGYGALWIRNEYPEIIDGVVLMAPYLGDKSVVTEVEKAGNLASWRASLDREPDKDDFPWIWLSEMIDPSQGEIDNLILVYGTSDKFSRAAKIVTRYVNSTAVIEAEGSHDWKTWLKLWQEVLDSSTWNALTSRPEEADGISRDVQLPTNRDES